MEKITNARLLRRSVTEEELKDLYEGFMETYHDDFPEYAIDSMNEDAFIGLNETFAPCYIAQFYDEYNLMVKEYNLYLQFLDILKRNHQDLSGKTILDVGGGVVPSLGRRLAKDAKHVIVVDEYVTNKNNPTNLEVIKKEITDAKQLPSADLIIGFMPCEATKYIVEHACNTGADFFAELCGCVHDGYAMPFEPMYYTYFYRSYFNERSAKFKSMVDNSPIGSYSERFYKKLPYTVVSNKRIK